MQVAENRMVHGLQELFAYALTLNADGYEFGNTQVHNKLLMNQTRLHESILKNQPQASYIVNPFYETKHCVDML